MNQRFTREEFYELVWSKPLTHLAKDFRLSDVALHNICRKHDIPNPPLGWWAKHAADHKLKRSRLPKAKAGVALTVVIASGEVRQESDKLASADQGKRICRSISTDTAGQSMSSKPGKAGSKASLSKCQPHPFAAKAALLSGFANLPEANWLPPARSNAWRTRYSGTPWRKSSHIIFSYFPCPSKVVAAS